MSDGGSQKGEEEPKVILVQEQIQKALSNLMKTPGKYHPILTSLDGASYAYTYLNIEEPETPIQDLVDVNDSSANKGICALEKYQYLRVLNLNKNAFTNIDKVKSLDFLFELSAAGNQIADVSFLGESMQNLKYLQKVDLTQNKITKLPQLACPLLKKLILDENEISECALKGHQALKILSLNKNKLKSGEGLGGLKQLTELSIQENETFTTVQGMFDLPALKKLSCNGSGLETLNDFPELPCLEELALDGTKIAKADEFTKLKACRNLKSISAAECTLGTEGGADVRKEILMALMDHLPNLKTLNGEPFDEEFRKECKEEKLERIRAAEEAAKAAAENPAGEEPAED